MDRNPRSSAFYISIIIIIIFIVVGHNVTVYNIQESRFSLLLLVCVL